MPHRVLHILGSAQPWNSSIARMVGALAAGLDPERYQLQAWFVTGPGSLAAELEAAGAQVRVLPWRGARGDPAGTLRLWRALRGARCSIVHGHFGGRSLRWMVRGATQASFVVHLHTLLSESGDPISARMLARGAERVIAVCQAVAERAAAERIRCSVVYPGLRIPDHAPDREALPSSPTGRVIGTACRLVPLKGVVHLVRALPSLRAEFPELRLEVAGAGPELGAIQNQVSALGLAGRVRFLGWQADLGSVLAGWDIFAQPSLQEAAPVALLEAMAAGLPVVASAVGGVPEILEDGRTGWLVPPADPVALAERLGALLRDPERRRAMGGAGRERARQNFSVERMVAEISRIYDGIVDSRVQG